ncbi:MAG: kelch repeat-containing protein [Pseudomonadota bacterium]
MGKINRREALTGIGATMGAMTASLAQAHDTTAPKGAWTTVAPLPAPVQEIYPAPFFYDRPGREFERAPYNIIVSAGGLTPDSDHNVTDAVTYYDPLYDEWGFATKLPAPRHHIGLVNNRGYLYALGGFSRQPGAGWRMERDCWRLSSVDGDWDAVAPLPIPQAENVCVSLGGYIHVVGGRSPAGSLNAKWSDHIDTSEHWLYDASIDRWFSLAPLPTERNSAAGVVFSGTVYVFGGRTVDGGNSNAVEVYDPLADRWEKARPMPQAQGGLAAAVLNGKIYVFGGEYFSPRPGGVFNETWEYDPYRDTWRAVAPMSRPRHGLGAVSLGDAIYAIGGAAGVGGVGTTSAVDKFEI